MFFLFIPAQKKAIIIMASTRPLIHRGVIIVRYEKIPKNDGFGHQNLNLNYKQPLNPVCISKKFFFLREYKQEILFS